MDAYARCWQPSAECSYGARHSIWVGSPPAVSATLSGVPAGTANLYLTFTGSGSLFDLDQFILVKS